MPIDENGELYAMVTCGSVPTFEVDVETGLLKEVKMCIRDRWNA